MAGTTEELKDLANLLREGLITREEFDQQKAVILSGGARGGGPSTSTSQPRFGGSNPPRAGESLGAYSLLGVVGQGGMGVVYRGKHRTAAMARRQGGEVAIKVLHAQYAQDGVFRDRFEREAGMGGKLDHPGIVKVHDLVIDGGNLALVMDLAEGRPLSEVIGQETGPIPWERAWPMFKQMLDAVAYAHEHNVVHRDIKPENVIVSPKGKLKVLDFGIAKDMEGGKTKTGTGMGTVDYMAPEQYTDAKSVDQRADVYALGMTLYEMLAGRLPWKPSDSEFAVMSLKAKGELPPPTDFYPHIPAHLIVTLNLMLEVNPTDRLPDCAAVADRLKESGVPEPDSSQALSSDDSFDSKCQILRTGHASDTSVEEDKVSSPSKRKGRQVIAVAHSERYSRIQLVLRTFLGWLYIGLPHGVALIGLGILSLVVTFLAFWVVLLLGRYPRGFFNFQVMVLQWQWRVGCSLCNLVDGYPSFGLGSDGDPAWTQIPYPERLGRLHLLFRLLLGFFYVFIPHGLILSIRFLLSFVLGFLAFLSVLFTGRYPRSFHDFNAGSLRWSFRYNLYLFFLTDTYPPFSGREDVG